MVMIFSDERKISDELIWILRSSKLSPVLFDILKDTKISSPGLIRLSLLFDWLYDSHDARTTM